MVAILGWGLLSFFHGKNLLIVCVKLITSSWLWFVLLALAFVVFGCFATALGVLTLPPLICDCYLSRVNGVNGVNGVMP